MNTKFEVYPSYKDFKSLKEQWPESKSRYFETDFEYLSSLYKESIVDGEPLTLRLEDSTGKSVVINGIIQDIKYSPKITYFTLKFIRFKKKCFLVRPYSILGEINDITVAKDIELALSAYCRKHDIDYVNFSLLSRESAFTKYLSDIKNPLKRDPSPLIEEHYLLEVPESLDDYFKTKDAKGRYNLKRLMKQLENAYKVNLRIFTKLEDVEVFCEHAEIIAQKSHLRPINAGFKSTPTEIKKKKILANIDLFRSYILYIDGKPAAFICGIIYKRSFFTEHIGFDIQYERLSIGSYLLLKAIEDIAANRSADIIDYSYGSDSYKKRFSSLSLCSEDIRIKLFIPKISNILFMTNIAFFNAITDMMRKMLKKTGMYTKIRKNVRNLLRTSRNN